MDDSLDLSAFDPGAFLCNSVCGPYCSMTVFDILEPVASIARAIRPSISTKPVFFVSQVRPLVPTALRKSEIALPMLFVALKFSRVSITTCKSNGADTVHLVVYPITFVQSAFRKTSNAVAVPFALVVVSFV